MAILLAMVSCQDKLQDDLLGTSFSTSGNYPKEFIGTWSMSNQVTVNQDDGKRHRIFPYIAGELHILSSKLALGADGRFQMVDEKINRQWSGIWKSNAKGTLLDLYFEGPMSADGPASSTPSISLNVSLKGGSMEALQTYRANNGWSAGEVYYAFEKQ
jgi:hypothetical protein